VNRSLLAEAVCADRLASALTEQEISALYRLLASEIGYGANKPTDKDWETLDGFYWVMRAAYQRIHGPLVDPPYPDGPRPEDR
jgi:hypothetical protein